MHVSRANASGPGFSPTRIRTVGLKPDLRVPEYTLYCFAQSRQCQGGARARARGADWSPRFVDYFNGETRTPAYRAINVMGEVPVLEASRAAPVAVGRDPRPTSPLPGRFGPGDDDNAATSCAGRCSTTTSSELHGDVPLPRACSPMIPIRTSWPSSGKRAGAWACLDAHLAGRAFVVGGSASPSPISRFAAISSSTTRSASTGRRIPIIATWLARIRAAPRWRASHDLMPGHPPAQRECPKKPLRYDDRDHQAQRGIGIVALNRPDLHNAFNEILIAELTRRSMRSARRRQVRAVILMGTAKFCAGADLNWMKKMAGYSRAQNMADARALAEMLRLNDLPKPTIARTARVRRRRRPHRVLRHRDRRGRGDVR